MKKPPIIRRFFYIKRVYKSIFLCYNLARKRNEYMSNGLIRTRINENVLKVQNESENVKGLLSIAVRHSKVDDKTDVCYEYIKGYGYIKKYIKHKTDAHTDMLARVGQLSRDELLHTALLVATSRNKEAQQALISAISRKLGRIDENEYVEMAEYIYNKQPKIANKVNDFLNKHIQGFQEQHQQYYAYFYNC